MGWLVLLALSCLSGVFGRLGGRAKDGSWYDCITHSKARDVGCALISVVAFCVVFGFQWSYWWVYLLMTGLTYASFLSYYDSLFGHDEFFFAGALVGLAILPTLIINVHLWPFILIRALVLAVSWGCLNRFLPDKVLFWRRDVAEEFLRYAISF